MSDTEQAIAALRNYSSTSWENGGAGESTLVSEIRLVLAEVERLGKRIVALEGHLTWIGWSSDGVDRCKAEVKRLREAFRDCLTYINIDNLTTQTKYRNWQAVLDGHAWDSSNVDIDVGRRT